ncbi:MAG: beta-galactosidase [Planctomycetes bacterium]|nr:beta-galactosidase [Planctomycetota bacterium]
MSDHPGFLFGAQYYRAPTPSADCWEGDLRRMRELGLTSAKFWVQWRWSHRAPGRFVFDDLDRLMDLAAANGLAVHLNTIFDVPPLWLFETFPDALPLLPDGRAVIPHEVAHRQLGGSPGPSLHHPGARAAREEFLRAAVLHFRGHPALAAWDVWNEPEIGFPYRATDADRLLDYNPHAIAGFQAWLGRRYGGDIARLNQVWGRCYDRFEQVEAPRTGLCLNDFVDWRLFQAETMSGEADWRFAVVRELDPGHLRFLHLVPNFTDCWNAVGTATDDAGLLRGAQVAAATGAGRPWWFAHMASVAAGRTLWNTEVHINFGSTAMHQRVLGLDAVRRDLLAQIGGGVRGFQFWQFRAEVLGTEAPAWGMVRPDGSDRPITTAIADFWRTLRPHAEGLAECPAPAARAEVGLWRSDGNEIAQAAIHRDLARLSASLDGWLPRLHWRSLPVRLVDRRGTAGGALAGLRLLVMPQPYWLTQEEADAVAAWVEAGGTLLCDAHLAGYDGSRGRHSAQVPGCGLAARFGLREAESCSSFHLDLQRREALAIAINDDVRKALGDSASGGRLFPLACADGGTLLGAERYAELEGDGLEALAWFHPGKPVVVTRAVGRGRVVYAGTDLGLAAKLGDPAGLDRLLGQVLERAGIAAPGGIAIPAGRRVRVDHLHDRSGRLRFAVAHNDEDAPQEAALGGGGWRGLFDAQEVSPGARVMLAGRSAELFVAV